VNVDISAQQGSLRFRTERFPFLAKGKP